MCGVDGCLVGMEMDGLRVDYQISVSRWVMNMVWVGSREGRSNWGEWHLLVVWKVLFILVNFSWSADRSSWSSSGVSGCSFLLFLKINFTRL